MGRMSSNQFLKMNPSTSDGTFTDGLTNNPTGQTGSLKRGLRVIKFSWEEDDDHDDNPDEVDSSSQSSSAPDPTNKVVPCVERLSMIARTS